MDGRITEIEGIIGSILRGSAKILGCTSASLITFNASRREVRLQVGTLASSLQPLERVEAMVGDLEGASFPFEMVEDSLVFRAWKNRSVHETSSLGKLAGNAFGEEVLGPVTAMIGKRRFICVPALTGDTCHGLVVFEKAGSSPFSRQQRELLLQYAQRIGDIIESNPKGDESILGAIGSREGLHRVEPAGSQLIHLAMGESAPAVLVNPSFRITSCNEAAERLLGYPTGEIVGRNVETLFEDREQIRALLNHQFLSLTDGYFEEGTVLKRRSGRHIPGKVETLLLADRKDRVVGFLVLIRDRSEKVRGPGDRRGLDRLMRQERLATMGEMAAQLAHEIRNPLVAIGATLEHVAADLDEGRDVRETVADVRQEIARIDMILKTYLSIAARHKSSLVKVDLSRVVADAVRLLDGSRKNATKNVTSHLKPGIEVLADADGLMHVFFNLLLNGLEAIPPGGEITCSSREDRDRVSVLIDDTGPGMGCGPEDCFQTFFTTKKNGTGLGLTVCRKIVEAHGGTVSLENREEGGCRATVVLPRKVMA